MTKRKKRIDFKGCPRCGRLLTRRSGFKWCGKCDLPVNEVSNRPTGQIYPLAVEDETEIRTRLRNTTRGNP